jgi:histone H2A
MSDSNKLTENVNEQENEEEYVDNEEEEVDMSESFQENNEPVKDNSNEETKKKKQMKEKRAGLIFSVSRSRKSLKKVNKGERISNTACVYLAAVGEYLIAEISDICQQIVKTSKRPNGRINPNDLFRAMKEDDDINQLLDSVTFNRAPNSPYELGVNLEKLKLDRAISTHNRLKNKSPNTKKSKENTSVKSKNPDGPAKKTKILEV